MVVSTRGEWRAAHPHREGGAGLNCSERLAPCLKASGDTVEQFIADRHAEADREEAEYLESRSQSR